MPAHYTPTVKEIDLAPGAGVDIVGDLHGCMDEFVTLIRSAGYQVSPNPSDDGFEISHPQSRQLFLVGDITDRGPRNLDALRFVRDLVASGVGSCVVGNHDDKLIRALMGRKLKVGNGLQGTLDELDVLDEGARDDLRDMLQSLPTQILLRRPGERDVLIVHGAAPDHHQMLPNKNSYQRSIYGYPKQAEGDAPPVRLDWAADYTGERIVVHGHVPGAKPVVKNRVYNLDTGCAFGNKLTLYQLDRDRFLFEHAKQIYFKRKGFSKKRYLSNWIERIAKTVRRAA